MCHVPRTLLQASLGAYVTSILSGCFDQVLIEAEHVELRWDTAEAVVIDARDPIRGTAVAWTVSDAPKVKIGGDPNEPGFLFRAASAARFRDGRIVIANRGTQELLFFDEKGKALYSRGGKGGGPGEFEGLHTVELFGGDSLLVYDLANQRVSVLDAHGVYVRSFRLQVREAGTPYLLAHLSDGSLLVSVVKKPRGYFLNRGGPTYSAVTLLRVGSKGRERLAELGRYPLADQYVYGESATRRIYERPILFGRELRVSASGELIAVGHTERYEIALFGLDGRIHTFIQGGVSSRSLTSADLQRAKDSVLAGAEDDQVGRLYQKMFSDGLIPATLPAFSQLHVDRMGMVWVERYPVAGESTGRWSVFDAEGRRLGDVAMRRELEILEIGWDYILARSSDELGVESVVLHSLER